MNKLEVKNLTKIFNGKLAINQINFSLKENSILGVLGPNGSGKSTTIGILLGLIKQTSGEIYINDTYINKKNRFKFLNIMNFASPYTELPKRLSVIENLSIYLKKYNRWVYTPISYQDLLRFAGSVAVYDENDKDTVDKQSEINIKFLDETTKDGSLKTIDKLVHFGWKKEAIPVFKFKKSIIARFFETLFG